MAVKDQFVNIAYLTVTEGGANTLTFNQLTTNIPTFEKVGFLICRIDYIFDIDITNWAATNDGFHYGLCTSDQIAAAVVANSAVVDYNFTKRLDIGTAASGFIKSMCETKSFADLKGGGILVPPNPIYIFALGAALTSAMKVEARMYYTIVQLKGEEFWELVEQRRMIGT